MPEESEFDANLGYILNSVCGEGRDREKDGERQRDRDRDTERERLKHEIGNYNYSYEIFIALYMITTSPQAKIVSFFEYK